MLDNIKDAKEFDTVRRSIQKQGHSGQQGHNVNEKKWVENANILVQDTSSGNDLYMARSTEDVGRLITLGQSAGISILLDLMQRQGQRLL